MALKCEPHQSQSPGLGQPPPLQDWRKADEKLACPLLTSPPCQKHPANPRRGREQGTERPPSHGVLVCTQSLSPVGQVRKEIEDMKSRVLASFVGI